MPEIDKILFINSPQNDFLQDSFLIGLKEVYGSKVIEYPVNNHIYKKETQVEGQKLHGIGFTLYNLLDLKEAVSFEENMDLSEFDLFIFADIYRQADVYKQLSRYLTKQNTIILDGEDTPAIFPFYFPPWKKQNAPFSQKYHRKHLYFKREIIKRRTNYYQNYKITPKFITPYLSLPKNLEPISFSIPDAKITKHIPEKTKRYPAHIVDEEVCNNVPGSKTKYAFDKEADYYQDLQNSQFGITTKRGGWDCLRHYEIAANGAVICFKNLHLKPEICAPHDLIPGENCLNYSNFEDLEQQINALSEQDYKRLQENSLKWVNSKSCKAVVENCLNRFFEWNKK